MSEGAPWTQHDLALLKREYAKALAQGKEVFKFEGNDVLVSHVKVLIETLTERFRKEKRK